MSSTLNLSPDTIAAAADQVSIQIGDTAFVGWETVVITMSCETMPNSWSLSASPEFLQSPDAMKKTVPGQACTILIGGVVIITGWIDRRHISLGPSAHGITLSGRGITRNLVDCSADLIRDPSLAAGTIKVPNVLNLATRLAGSFGIKCRSPVADLGPEIIFVISLGETPYEIIESAARYAGFLLYEDSLGTLVLDRIGTNAMASGFTAPGNIEDISASLSVDQRFSDYMVVWTAIPQLGDLGVLNNHRALVQDEKMTEYRPRIIVSEQQTPLYDVAIARANWEKARRVGRSQAAEITVGKWRDTAGKLWTPNWLAPVDAPAAGIFNANWIIGTVTLRKDANGTHADLVLMPPDAFNPEPNPLNLFDAILAPSTSQAPAPPTTNPPTPGVH